ncbi:Methyltransferase type 12 [Methanosarcina horonobensis HB-1 = JCM 15518]|uniref:Methyltransferase type 12 n=1 Tax=Methanosarcina horonobensis HB-1 = JCM 15518 TaxID=1434110 RepID=A0A0E3SC99_9EURY|nr:methyltransferase domain-containing protein [Methanosarcina horonobensis]AKB79589.1 Methyltransferase type 12 [Methanosarcina horonobensis HB-1 = JCM 15518]
MDNNLNNYKANLTNKFIPINRQYEVYENYYRKNVLKHLPLNKSAKIIDLGCGLGHFLYFLKSNNYTNISGIDLLKENVEFCRLKEFKVKQENIIDHVSSSNEKADTFILSNVLEHFSYQEIIYIINSLYKLLNKNGRIIIIVPNCNNIHGLATYFSDITHKSPLTEKSFEDLILNTEITKFSFENLVVYPNIVFLDTVSKIYNSLIFNIRKINNLMNGQKPYKVQSKNLLLIIYK